MRQHAEPLKRNPPFFLATLWISVLIAVAVVLRRLYALTAPSTAGPPQMVGLDRAFEGHSGLTLAHIVPALMFALLAPVVLLRRDSTWVQPVLWVLGTIVGITAYAMNAFAVGGRVEQVAVLFFNTLFLYQLWKAFLLTRRGDSEAGRRCWIRAIAILFGIATTRPVMGVFFATSRFTGWQPNQFFGPAFWIGFSINTVVAEWWLRRRRSIA